jgi:hypothetical protein
MNAFDGDDADVRSPIGGRFNKRSNKKHKILRRRRMDSEQDNARFRQRASSLNGDLPKILVESQNEARLGFAEV